ncbi:MAG: hypothetical protein A2044_04465 [Candidatus Firestonebacteria bacterium GWA2_43_8]|nr:MAG: hypothetical protein A2044_04465 [Candidatus Firestonebacteria bacterium GWA2_43_8]
MLKVIKKTVTADKKYLVALLGKLVEIPTLSEPGLNYEKLVKVLEKECKSIGLKTKIIKVTDKKFINTLKAEFRKYPRYILMAYWNTGAKKTLHFNGHYDVVPASLGFSKDPFKLNIKGDKIMARGAADMKSGIVAMLGAVKALKKLNIKPAWNLEFSFVPDEEIGGRCGSGYICYKKIAKADAVIEGDGGGGNNLTVAHRGIVGFRVTVLGKAVHAALHTRGVNAFLKAVDIVNELEKLRKKLEKRTSKYYTKVPISKVGTMMIGGLAGGGLKSNSVPDKFTFTIDRRVIPEESMKKARKEIVDLISKVAKRDGTFKVKIEASEATHSAIETDAPICKLLGGILTEYYGEKPVMLMTGGRLDSAFFSRVLKKPTLAFGVSGAKYHADDEYTTGKDIITATTIYAQLMCKGY